MADPSPFQDLAWTSRTEVCDALARFLAATPQSTYKREPLGGTLSAGENGAVYRIVPGPRELAITVLAALAEPCHAEVLRRLFLNLKGVIGVRVAVLSGLFRLKADLPREALDAQAWEPWFERRPPFMAQLLLLTRQTCGLEGMQRILNERDPSVRAHVLLEFLQFRAEVPLLWTDWLYSRWVAQDRAALDADQYPPFTYHNGRHILLNARIAHLTRDRPESREIIAGYRRLPSNKAHRYQRANGTSLWPGGWESLPPELWNGEEELLAVVAAEPEAYRERADLLDLPYTALALFLEPDSLLSQVEAALRRDGHKWGIEWEVRTWRAFELLRRWPDERAGALIQSLSLCPEMKKLRFRLLSLFWERAAERDPAAIRDLVRSCPEGRINPRFLRRELRKVAENPEPEDREFLFRVSAVQKKPEFRYHAVRGLERLGEASDEWRSWLHALTEDPDSTVRVVAWGALARLGEETALPFVLQAAGPENEDDYARSEALRILAEREAPGVFALLRAAMLEPGIPFFGASGVEAAYQLARLGTAEALTPLLQGCLATEYPAWVLPYLEAAATAQPLPEPGHRSRIHRL